MKYFLMLLLAVFTMSFMVTDSPEMEEEIKVTVSITDFDGNNVVISLEEAIAQGYVTLKEAQLMLEECTTEPPTCPAGQCAECQFNFACAALKLPWSCYEWVCVSENQNQ